MAYCRVRIGLGFYISLILCGISSIISADKTCNAPLLQTEHSTISGTCTEFRTGELGLEKNVASYRGLRYAEPPTGPRRFAPPVPRGSGWGKVDGTKSGTGCPQGSHPVYNTETGNSEDCLFIDVFIPLPKPKDAPVMVWLHGGGFIYGAGTVNMLSPLPLVALGDVIVVTLNYRLGALGYLTTGDEEIPPNLGILDQMEALRWIKKHISVFGGDPDRITLFGDSAGSTSIHIHLMSPLSNGLFHRAVMQSGSATSLWARGPNMVAAGKRARVLGQLVGCSEGLSSAQLKQCLMEVPAQTLVDNQQQVLKVTSEPADISFVPIVDHLVIPDSPDIVGKSGSYNNVTLLIGANSDEGMMAMMKLFPNAVTDTPIVKQQQFREYLSTAILVRDPVLLELIAYVYGTTTHSEIAESVYTREIDDNDKEEDDDDDDDDDKDDDNDDDDEHYDKNNDDDHNDGGDDGKNVNKGKDDVDDDDGDDDDDDRDDDNDHAEVNSEIDFCVMDSEVSCNHHTPREEDDFFDVLNDIVGDMTMFCPNLAVANFAAKAGMEVYQYHNTHRPSVSFWHPLRWTRVNHGENLVFVFGFHFLSHLDWTLTPEEVDMTLHVLQYYTNFAATGDPNQRKDNQQLVEELEPWPIYTLETGLWKNLSPAMSDDQWVRARLCRFWNEIFPTIRERMESTAGIPA